MSAFSEIAGMVTNAGNALQPHLVVTAPDGSQLWIPVEIPTLTGSAGSSTSLWPAGFKISVALAAPPDLPNVSTSAPGFLASHSFDLLKGWLS